jgi:hypothetical protein
MLQLLFVISSQTLYSIFGPQWLKKQAEARQIVDLEDSDLTEEEKNPQFLQEKGK